MCVRQSPPARRNAIVTQIVMRLGVDWCLGASEHAARHSDPDGSIDARGDQGAAPRMNPCVVLRQGDAGERCRSLQSGRATRFAAAATRVGDVARDRPTAHGLSRSILLPDRSASSGPGGRCSRAPGQVCLVDDNHAGRSTNGSFRTATAPKSLKVLQQRAGSASCRPRNRRVRQCPPAVCHDSPRASVGAGVRS
jgi:hypothetical protein